MKKADVQALDMNAVRMIGDEWMLITARKGETINTMTASWGGLGVLWGRPVATVYIRPQRYTKEFVDAGDTFTLTFFGGEHKKEMGYLGKVSGRDGNKIADSGLTLAEVGGVPTFAEAKLMLVCRKLYEDDIKPELFKDSEIDGKWYPDRDYHRMYIAEITAAYVPE
mgnify:CR=1 FL=1